MIFVKFKKCDRSTDKIVALNENCIVEDLTVTDFPERDSYLNVNELAELLRSTSLIKKSEKWHVYLYNNYFTLYTDHKALFQLMILKNYVGRLGRQALMLQEYSFTIKYLL